MQSNLVYIYKNETDVQISDDFDGTRNKVVYAHDLVIHKNVDNVLFFQVKNADQRRIPIGNKVFTFTVFDDRREYPYIILELPCVITDAHTGKFKCTVPEQYFYDVEEGLYNYSIKVCDVSGVTQPAYVDDHYGVRGTLSVRAGSAPLFRETNVLTFNTLTSGIDLTDVVGEITSIHQNNSLHTALIKFDDADPFTGDVIVQGTMDNITNQFPASVNFFDIATVNFVAQVDNIAINFNGVYSGIRFFQENITLGAITEIQYRY